MATAGAKKNYEVLVRSNGFNKTELVVPEGKSVIFLVDKKKSASNENNDIVINWNEVFIIEVIGDDPVDGKYRPVNGGFQSDKSPDRFIVKFKLSGDYYFKMANNPKNPPLCKIRVIEEQPLNFLITEEGFLPRIIRIEENCSLKWSWTKLSYPHSIYEAEYCEAHNGIVRTSRELVPASCSAFYKRNFKEPGLYYFQTEARNYEQKNICLVEVYQSYREYSVEILDNQFSPARIIVEEGDRVRFSWNKERCQRKHCIYQIEAPQPDHPQSSPYFPVKDGFKWSMPTRCGIVWHTFEKCGVYYYSDMSETEAASYIGIIVVKQKSEHHVIEYDVEKNSFGIDLLTLETGDSVWWKWTNTQALVTIKLSDYSLIWNKKIDIEKCRNIKDGCEQLDANGIARTGVRSFSIKFAGIYYFDIFDGDNISTFTIVATSVQKDHKISITDTEAKPKILEIYPEDRVWFVWDDTRKPKNIRQVNHQNEILENGFLSGSLIESPGTFLHSFTNEGVYFYRTDNLNEILGAVVVVQEPTIQLVNVAEDGLDPDPIIVHVNDTVIWAFPKYQSSNLVLIETDSDLLKYATLAQDILPRRHLSYSFKDPGVYHFASPSFDDTIDASNADATKGLDNSIISSVIVDIIQDHTSVVVDSNGFHPNIINVEISKNVLFDWETSNQTHNIIHVTMPSEKNNKLQIVSGPNAFNSGQPVMNNKFLHRFDEEGTFCVISEGASDTYCLVRVLQKAFKTETPELVNEEPYVLYKYHKIFLDCKTPDSTIHYTLDGSMPSKLSLVYDPENAVIMNEEGINILRAIAYSENNLTSDIFTSQRFYVIQNPEDLKKTYAETTDLETSSATNEEWWRCIPKISYTTVGAGCVEISWETPATKSLELISHYQLFLNKVTYKRMISPYTTRLLVKDLAGAKNYEAILMVFPKGEHLVPQQSNILNIESPSKTNLGGPVISLKANSNDNQMTICWPSIDSKKTPIDYYRLLINGEKRETIKPNVGIHRVTIENCKENFNYSIILVAIPKDGSVPLISNELEITLPLNLSEINLPDQSLRKLDKDYYNEYIEIIEYTIEQTLIDSLKETSEPDLEEKRLPKTAPYQSYDNYITGNKDLSLDTNFLNKNEDEPPNLPDEYLKKIQKISEKLDGPESEKFNQENIVIQSQILNDIIADSTDDDLPIPMVGVFHLKTGSISIVWRIDKLPPKDIKLIHYVISLVGCEFGTSIKSDSSIECTMEQINGTEIEAIQHNWITKFNSNLENKFTIEGVLDTAIYQITVNAIYRDSDSNEFKRTSKVIDYTALGPPEPPRLRVNAVDLQSVNLEWLMSPYPKPDFIKGYRLIVNSEPNEIFEKNINEFIFKDMQPGFAYEIEILTLTNWMVGACLPSNKITLLCPSRPLTPVISQLPSLRSNSVIIGWKPVEPKSTNKSDQILLYKVFVNRKYHGEIYSTNSSSYSYTICDLNPGKSYDVMVQTLCGERITQAVDNSKVSCIVQSEFSNYLPVTPTCLPSTSRLKLASLSPDGIDITWDFPQQYGDASCSGYQLVKNGKCYGNIIPPEVNTYRISDIDIGETITLQIICLTNHPVGKYTALHNHPDYTMDYPQREFLSNTQDDLSQSKMNKVTDINNLYPACKPGPALSVKYTNIVKPAIKVWTERITGYTATLFFQTIEALDLELTKGKMNSHFIDPEYFLVSYWPGYTPDNDIRSVKTEKDFVNLTNLNPTTIYTVQVESRRELKRSEDLTDLSDKNDYKFISYSKSSQLQFQTASPPDPPSNLSIITTTCHAIKIAWDPPVDHGSDLIATRIDCFPLNTEKPVHIFKELTPDCTNCIIENLSEKTNYKITITAITEEYFYQHKIKEMRKLPKYILEDVPWLPSASIEAMTSGSDAATNLEWKLKHDNTITITWKQPKVYGTNKLINQVICYQEILTENISMAIQVPLQSNAKSYRLANVKLGSKYKIWIEAVVSIKLTIESDSTNNSEKIDHYKELKDHRCTNVLSEALILRVPAPCEPVSLLLTAYSNETIDFYWAKPCLYSKQPDPDNIDQDLHIYRHLIGYRLEVNQIKQRTLESNENSCTLTKCKPLNTYSLVIVSLSCLKNDAETSNSSFKTEIDGSEIDESFSEPLQVKTFPADRPDQINYIGGQYEEIIDTNESKSVGRIRFDWAIKDDKEVSQFNVIWHSPEESLTLRRSFDPAARSCYIPVTKSKCIYEIYLETVNRKTRQSFNTERLFIEVPGSPDSPTLWLLDQKDNNVTIHWSEPRVYPTVPISAYQIYVNSLKVGAKVDKDIFKATLPLKPNRMYKINVQALSSKQEYADSVQSNTITVSTSLTGLALPNIQPLKPSSQEVVSVSKKGLIAETTDIGSKFNDSQVVALKKHYENENEKDENESTLSFRVSKVAEDYFDLDWSKYSKNGSFDEYKILLHCLNTNEHSEIRLPSNTNSQRVKKLRSGFTYSVQLTAIRNNEVANKSKYLILQTSAPPDTPTLKIRVCNLKYITVEWNKSHSYGDAQVVAYKIYVDGKVEAVLSSEHTSFTLSKGEPCHEYNFQIQAMTADENLSSLISGPLYVKWPGISVINLRQGESDGATMKINWDDPILYGNAKVSYYNVTAVCEKPNCSYTQGPLENNVTECEFSGINLGKYKVNLEVYVYGSSEPFVSKPISVEFGLKPESPTLFAQVQGLDQRSKLDKMACNLVNKRDRILKIATNSNVRNSPSIKILVPKAMSTLRQLDEALDDCIKLFENYTGYFIVNLNWSCEQINPLVRIVGFKVYVNGKQYGSDLNNTMKSIRIKLPLEKAINTIYVTSFTDKPKIESHKSNRIELMSETFFPFSFYCLNNVHLKSVSWPEEGCCAYRDTLDAERNILSKTREAINQGHLIDPLNPPQCQVIEVASGKSNYLFEKKSSSENTTVVFFWTKWCLSSIRVLNYLVMFAQRNCAQNDFIVCHCGHENPTEMQTLLKQAGYSQSSIRFVIDVQLGNNKSSVDQLDIKGVPSILILNTFGDIAWKGRYCAYDYSSFESFMHHAISETNETKCPNNNNCFCCQEKDISIEKEIIEVRSMLTSINQCSESLERPNEISTNLNRKKKQDKITTKQLITSKMQSDVIKSGSEFGYNSDRSNKSLKVSRSGSIDQLGYCYYHKKH